MSIRFTVVVPAYNEERLIGDCLRSLAGQDFSGGVEVVVVDNNCTDRTAEIARSYGAVVVREEVPGVCAARHRGSAAARGEIVVSSDADTVFDASWLSRIDRRFREDPARVAVAGPCRYVGGPWWGRVYAGILFDLVHLVYRATGRVMYVTATNIAFRKDAWSGYDLTGTQGADELRLLRQLRTRGRVAFDRANPTFTSARRLARGLVYNVAVSFLFYYALAVMVNRVAGRPVIGTAPAFRSQTVERWKLGPRAQRIRARAVGLAWLAAIVAGAITAAGLVENTWLAKR